MLQLGGTEIHTLVIPSLLEITCEGITFARVQQIAERMHISVKTVYSKKHKIQSRLEAMLSQAQLAA